MKRTALLCIAILLGAAGARAGGLTIERMYADPRLAGIVPRSIAWSPDGKRIAFIWNDSGTRFYDIWTCDASGRNLKPLTNAAVIAGQSQAVLTRAEIDRLEVFRRTGHGIFSYTWSPDGKRILFPLEGDLFQLELKSGKVRRLFRTAASETDPKYSPDGKRVAFIRENEIWMIELESGMEIQLTDSGGETLYNGLGDYIDYEEVGRREAFWWSPDGSRIAYVQTDVSTVRALLIPGYLGIFVEVRKQLRPVAGGANGLKRLGVLDVETRETLWIEPGILRDEYICQVHWHPGGERLLLLSEPRRLGELHFISASVADGSTDTLVTVRDEKWVNISNTFVVWGGGGRTLYFTSEESGWNHVYRLDWETGKREALTGGAWEVTGLHAVDGRGRVWFTSTREDPAQRHLYYITPGGRLFRVTRGEGWYSAVLSDDVKRGAAVFSSITQPHDLYILESLKGTDVGPGRGMHGEPGSGMPPRPGKGDRGGGHEPPLYRSAARRLPGGLKRVTSSPAVDFGDVEIPLPYYFKLKSRMDGKTLHAFLLLPPALGDRAETIRAALEGRPVNALDEKYPVIVSVHGGGYAQSIIKSWRWRTLFDSYLVHNKGYIILDLDYRGSSGYGRAFRTDVHRAIGGPDLEDEMTGVEFLKTLPFVDPDRIGIWGWSYGGYMTALAMLRYPDAFYAGAGVAPVTDWKNYDTHYTEERLGLPEEEPEAYRFGSPVAHADSLRNHLLLIHGMGDDNVHFQDTVQLVDALIGTGVDFEVMFYPSGKHGIRADASRIHLFRKIVRHFERYLKADPNAHCP